MKSKKDDNFVRTIKSLTGNLQLFTSETLCLKGIVSFVVCLDVKDGVVHHSAGGWKTINYPHLGNVCWKYGITGAGGWYFLLRVNGILVIKSWPDPNSPKESLSHWVAPAAYSVSKNTKMIVEGVLGKLP